MTFDEVLAVRTDEKKILGGEQSAKAKVTGKIVKHVRGPKLKVLKYKTGGQYKIQTGHRQNYTRRSGHQLQAFDNFTGCPQRQVPRGFHGT